MRKFLSFLSITAIVVGLTACPAEPELYSNYTPILMSRQQLETSVQQKPAQPISNPGKIYLYGDYLFINEKYKGIHIINNQEPKAPQNVAFIQVPGNIDFAVKQNVLYVDNAVDLVALDLQNLQDIKFLKRIKNTFPALLAPDNLTSDLQLNGLPSDAVVVGWELKTK